MASVRVVMSILAGSEASRGVLLGDLGLLTVARYFILEHTTHHLPLLVVSHTLPACVNPVTHAAMY